MYLSRDIQCVLVPCTPPEAVRAEYFGLLARALEDEAGVLPEEAARLKLVRDRHKITAKEHAAMLQQLGADEAEFAAKLALGDDVQTYIDVVAATLPISPRRSSANSAFPWRT